MQGKKQAKKEQRYTQATLSTSVQTERVKVAVHYSELRKQHLKW